MTSSATADPAFQKLVNMLGAERAASVVQQTLERIGLETLRTPDDRYLFARELMKQGGILEAVGRAMRIQAILHGAREDLSA